MSFNHMPMPRADMIAMLLKPPIIIKGIPFKPTASHAGHQESNVVTEILKYVLWVLFGLFGFQ